MRHLTALLFVLFAALPAAAQEPGVPGKFDYYILALSWSPEYCAEHGDDPAARSQCAGQRHFGLVVHGLWPQDNDDRYPAACRPAARVPGRIVDRVLPIMPSERLIQHEWKAHGTCSGLSMDDYFDALGRAFLRVQVPAALQDPRVTVRAGTGRIKQLFAEANPGLAPGMMAISCSHGNAVSEIRVCLDKGLNFRNCGAGVADNCRASEEKFLPVR